MKKKIAVYVAGDKKIFYPALVSLISIKERNGNLFDFFVCFDEIESNQLKILEKHEIGYIDTNELYKDICGCIKVDEREWPIEVLFNYLIPNVLLEMGYDYSIKVDWDLLCLNSWNIDEIIKPDRVVSANYWRLNILNEGVPAAIFDTSLREREREIISMLDFLRQT